MADRQLPAVGWWQTEPRPLPFPPWWRWGEHDHPTLKEIQAGFVTSVPSRTRMLASKTAHRFAGNESPTGRFARPFSSICHLWLHAINEAPDFTAVTGYRPIPRVAPDKWPHWKAASRDDACAVAAIVDGIIGPMYTIVHDYVWLATETPRGGPDLTDFRYPCIIWLGSELARLGGSFFLNATPVTLAAALESRREELERLLESLIAEAESAKAVTGRILDVPGADFRDPSLPDDATPVDPDTIARIMIETVANGTAIVPAADAAKIHPKVPDGVPRKKSLGIVLNVVRQRLGTDLRHQVEDCYGDVLLMLYPQYGWLDYTVAPGILWHESHQKVGAWLAVNGPQLRPLRPLIRDDGEFTFDPPSTHQVYQPERAALNHVVREQLWRRYRLLLDRAQLPRDEYRILFRLFYDCLQGMKLNAQDNTLGTYINTIIEELGITPPEYRERKKIRDHFRRIATQACADHLTTEWLADGSLREIWKDDATFGLLDPFVDEDLDNPSANTDDPPADPV